MKMRAIRPFGLLSALGLCPVQQALPQVAVLEAVIPQDMDPAVIVPITDKICEALVNSGKYTVLDREHVAQVMAEPQFQLSGMVNTEEVRRFGEDLGTDLVFVTRAASMRSTYLVSACMIDVKTGAMDASPPAATIPSPPMSSPQENIAANPRRTGYPSPLESDAGGAAAATHGNSSTERDRIRSGRTVWRSRGARRAGLADPAVGGKSPSTSAGRERSTGW